jgi:deoxyribodipyrimidine photolyase
MSNVETINTKFLIKELSIAQREVITEAIRKWKEKELADANLANNYINRNP